MKNRKLSVAVFAIAALFCGSCVNNSYDLSDIDTTAKVQVKDLVIPINLDAVNLDKVIDLNDDSQLQEVTDPLTGQKIYAVVKDGSFSSDPIEVQSFTASKPEINPVKNNLPLHKLNETLDQKLQDALDQAGIDPNNPVYADLVAQIKQTVWAYAEQIEEPLAEYEISTEPTTFESSKNDVDKSLVSIEEIGVDAEIKCTLEIDCVDDDGVLVVDNVLFSGVKVQLPKGLSCIASRGVYDPETGILNLSDIKMENGKVSVGIKISGIKASEDLTYENGHFAFKGMMGVTHGSIKIYTKNFVNGKTFFDLPDYAAYALTPVLSDITVSTFTGKIKYDVENMDVDPVTINNLPDFINGEETSLVIGNPQIYLSLNNPLKEKGYNLEAQAGLAITGEKGGKKRETLTLDEPGVIALKNAQNTFCISPSNPEKYYGYEKADWVKFSKFKDIVKGNGVPDVLNIEVKDACVPEQRVEKFKLGDKLNAVVGDYTFYAPLDLSEGSVIVYKTTKDGWSDETLDKVVVQKLKINATVDTDIPLGATLTITALGKDGKAISGVSFNQAELKANTNNQQFVFEQTSGEIKGLDGIELRATIISEGAEKTLGPKLNITLRDLKATVSGYYQDEL